MPFLSLEQPANGPPTHVATWQHPREAAEWLKRRAEQFERPDLYTSNPVARSYFAELSLERREVVTWTVNSPQGQVRLTVQPA